MARTELGRQGIVGTNKLRNVRTRIRCSSLEERITMKGWLQKRPGRERQQEKHVVDLPVQEYLVTEYEARIADALKVLNRGWRLAAEEPVECWMGDLIHDAVNSIVYMSAKVETNNVSSTCGFIMAYDETFATPVVLPADETPVQSLTPEKINYALDVGMISGVSLYILPYVDDGTNIAFGIIKHIELPVLN